jgi:hypothetical protein
VNPVPVIVIGSALVLSGVVLGETELIVIDPRPTWIVTWAVAVE